MPEVVVRKRARRRHKSLTARLERWVYNQRPRIAVVCAFLIAGLIGLVCVSFAVHSMDSAPDAGAGQSPN